MDVIVDPEQFAKLSMFGTPEEWLRCRYEERRRLVGLTMAWRALADAWVMPWDGTYAQLHLAIVAARAIIAELADGSPPREVRTILAGVLAGFPDPAVVGTGVWVSIPGPLDGIRAAGERQLAIALARECAASSPGH